MPGLFVLALVTLGLALVALIVFRTTRPKQVEAPASATRDEFDELEESDTSDPYNDGFGSSSSSTYSRRLSRTSSTYDGEYRRRTHTIAKWAMVGLFGLTALLTVFSSVTAVPTKTVAVVVEFGKPVRNLDNGPHIKAPYQKTTELDAAIKTDVYGNNPCTMTVRLANQSTACVHTSIRWQLRLNSASDLFQNHKDFDSIRTNLVTRKLNATLNEVFAIYDPLASVNAANNSKDGKPVVQPVPLEEMGRRVTLRMQAEIGTQIEVFEVLTPIVDFDETTQKKIDAYQAEIANTRIAQQRQQTATAEAAANRALAASVSKDPNVLVSKCFDIVAEMVKKNMKLPEAGQPCWPGGQSAVVIPTASGGQPPAEK
jgi:regulator of protease activity HflC (stomatin/prohibitin superfamily)